MAVTFTVRQYVICFLRSLKKFSSPITAYCICYFLDGHHFFVVKNSCTLVKRNGSFTLTNTDTNSMQQKSAGNGNATGIGTGNWTSTIGKNGSWFQSLSWTHCSLSHSLYLSRAVCMNKPKPWQMFQSRLVLTRCNSEFLINVTIFARDVILR